MGDGQLNDGVCREYDGLKHWRPVTVGRWPCFPYSLSP